MFFSYDSKHKKLIRSIASDPDTAFQLREVFEDPALGQAVADALGLADLKTKTNLTRLGLLEKLDARDRGIQSLEGIEFLNGLIDADLSGNQIRRMPDYTIHNPNLGNNKDSLIYMNLAGNPFLDPAALFSLEATDGRRRFINTFQNAGNRFGLGDVKDRIFGSEAPNPELVRIALDRFTPASVKEPLTADQREALTDALLLKYMAGKSLYYGHPVWQDSMTLVDGKPVIRADARLKALDSDRGIKAAADRIEDMLLPEDLYLARTLAQSAAAGEIKEAAEAGNSIPEILAWYTAHPDKLSDGYLHTDRGWEEKDDYAVLRQAQMSSQEAARLEGIADDAVRENYACYLRIRRVLETYLKDHPEREKAVSKLIRKSDEFATGFLDQYLKLQNNDLLSDSQKQTLADAGASFKKFTDGYEKDARAFFDQDIFDLEVEMKYIDMLAEADKEIIR